MKRIWLNVLGYQITKAREEGREEGSTYYLIDVRFGNAFVMRGISIEILGRKSSQNWAKADPKLEVVNRFKKGRLLRDTLMIAVGGSSRQITKAFQSDPPKMEFKFVKPSEWRGRFLRIPIDFIKFYNIRSPYSGFTSVYADIQASQHLLFMGVKIFDGNDFKVDPDGQSRILDPKLRLTINNRIRRRSIRELISSVSGTGNVILENKPVAKLKNRAPRRISSEIQFRKK